MKYNRTTAVNKAVLEVLEDRRHFSSSTFSGGVLTLTGDKDSNNTMAVSALGNDFVVAFCDTHGQVQPLSQVKKIVIIGGDKSDTIGVDKNIGVPVVVETFGGKDQVTQGNKWVSVVNELAPSTPGSQTSDTPPDGGLTPGEEPVVSSDPGPTDGPTLDPVPVVSNDPSPVTGPTEGPNPVVSTDPSQGQLNAQITVVAGQTIESGQAVHVDALNSVLGSDTALTAKYEWDFGDTDPNASFNTLAGWNAAHVYNQPGVYTVTLTITGSDGTVATATTQVTVNDASAMRTIYVSTNGSDSNDGLSPDSPVQTIGQAAKLLQANTRILFESGDTFNMKSGVNINYSNVEIGSYGTGAQPTLMWTGVAYGQTMFVTVPWVSNVSITGLTFDSIYNTDTEKDPPTVLKACGKNIVVNGNQFLNVTYGVDASGEPTGLLVQNNTAPLATGIRGYFVWVQGKDVTIIGNFVANSTREHIVRAGAGGVTACNISYNNLTNLSRTSVDKQDEAKSTIALQVGTYGYVSHNTLTSGPVGVGPLELASTATNPTYLADRFTWAVFEDNTFNCPVLIQPGAIDIMVRGNISNRTNAGAYVVNGMNALYNTQVVDLTMTHNTVINQGTSGNFLETTGQASGIVLTDNLFVAPNLIPGYNGAAGIVVYYQTDLSDFTEISNNIWPAANWTKYAGGGLNYVGQYWTGRSAYQTPAAWNANSQVSGDQFENVNLPSDFYTELATFNKSGVDLVAQAA